MCHRNWGNSEKGMGSLENFVYGSTDRKNILDINFAKLALITHSEIDKS